MPVAGGARRHGGPISLRTDQPLRHADGLQDPAICTGWPSGRLRVQPDGTPAAQSGSEYCRLVLRYQPLVLGVVAALLVGSCSFEGTAGSDDAAFRPAMELDRPICKMLTPRVQLDWGVGQTRFGYPDGREPSPEEATQFQSDLERLGFTELETQVAGGFSRTELRKDHEDREIDRAIQRIQRAISSSPDCG